MQYIQVTYIVGTSMSEKCSERMNLPSISRCQEDAAPGFRKCWFHLAAVRVHKTGDWRYRRNVRHVGTTADITRLSDGTYKHDA